MEGLEQRVQDHAQRAFMLAQMETRPPGYSIVAWACVLMDDPYDKLLGHYTKRVAREKDRVQFEASKAGLDGIFLEVVLPALPTNPPPELAAKSMALFKKWAKERAEQACQMALVPFLGRTRSPEVLRKAADVLRQCLDDLVQEPSFPRFTGKLKMNADGSFQVTLSDVGRR